MAGDERWWCGDREGGEVKMESGSLLHSRSRRGGGRVNDRFFMDALADAEIMIKSYKPLGAAPPNVFR